MSHIGDVAHEVDIVAVILKHTTYPVRHGKGAKVANVNIFVDGWAARVDAHMRRVERLKQVFIAGQSVIQVDGFVEIVVMSIAPLAVGLVIAQTRSLERR